MDTDGLRAACQAARTAILACDEAALDAAIAAAGAPDPGTVFGRAITAAVVAGGHDVQRFWLGTCTCHRPVPQVKVAACRPVTFDAELTAILTGAGIRVPPVYDGSTVGACHGCHEPIWIGPRQRTAADANPDMRVLCFRCATAQMGPAAQVMDLGNTPP